MDNNTPGPNNPYAPPSADVEPVDDGFSQSTEFIPGGRIIRAGVAGDIFGMAWAAFRRQPMPWVGAGLVFMIICGIAGCVPVAGQVLAALMLGGFMITCGRFWNTGVVEIGDLFAGFQSHGGPLAIFGLIQAGFFYLIVGPMWILDKAAPLIFQSNENSALIAGIATLMLGIAQIIAGCIVGLSNFVGPALVVFHNLKPFEAFKTSFSAWFRNWSFGLLFWLLGILIAICGVIACCLGIFVAFPVTLIASFLTYRAIFLAPPRSEL